MRSLAGLIALVACSGEEPAPFDVTPPRAVEAPRVDPDAIRPEPAQRAANPMLLPCPDGWSETGSPELTTCEPWPAGGSPACNTDQIFTPRDPNCAPIGSACAEWAADLPASGVLYVRADAAGGDGTRTSPFGTLAAALAVASEGDTIALSPGTFEGAAIIESGVSIVGACPAQTIINSALAQTPSERAALEFRADSSLRNLTISTTERYAAIARGARLSLTDTIVSESRLGVLAEDGGRLILDTVRFADIDGSAVAATNADLELTGVLIERALFGVNIGPAGQASIRTTAILASPVGVQAFDGAQVELSRSVVEGWGEIAIGVAGDGTSLVAEDVLLRGATGIGDGLVAREHARISARRTLIDRPGRYGAIAESEGSEVELTDFVVRDPIGDPTRPSEAYGLFAAGGAISGERIFISGAMTGGLIFLLSASAEISDLTVRDSRPAANGELGIGFDIQQNASAHLERIFMVRNRSAGLSVTRGAKAEVEDAIVTDTEPGNGSLGYGVFVAESAELVMARADLERNSGLAFAVTDGGKAQIASTSIRGTTTPFTDRARTSFLGVGLAVMMGGEVEAERLSIEENRDSGVIVSSGSGRFGGLAVRNTFGDGGIVPGFGIYAERPTRLEISHAIVEGNAHDAIRISGTEGGGEQAVELNVSDAILRGLGSDAPRGMTHGLIAMGNFMSTIDRVSVEQPAFAGIRFASNRASVVIRDVSIFDLDAGDIDAMSMPRGALIADGVSDVQISALSVANGAVTGILLNGSTQLTAEDVAIHGVSSGSSCGADCAASGILVFPESSALFERFEVREAQTAGVQMLGGEMTLRDGVIASSAIGVHHYTTVNPTMDRVRLDSNGIDVDTGDVPIPR